MAHLDILYQCNALNAEYTYFMLRLPFMLFLVASSGSVKLNTGTKIAESWPIN